MHYRRQGDRGQSAPRTLDERVTRIARSSGSGTQGPARGRRARRLTPPAPSSYVRGTYKGRVRQMHHHGRPFTGGQCGAPSGNASTELRCPATEEVIARVPEAREADIDRAVAAARTAFDEGPWPQTKPGERADVMARLLAALQERAG